MSRSRPRYSAQGELGSIHDAPFRVVDRVLIREGSEKFGSGISPTNDEASQTHPSHRIRVRRRGVIPGGRERPRVREHARQPGGGRRARLANEKPHRWRSRDLRATSTRDANSARWMIGHPRHNLISSRSLSALTMSCASQSRAGSRMRLSSQSGQSMTLSDGDSTSPPDACAISTRSSACSAATPECHAKPSTGPVSTRRTFSRMCGERNSANSRASFAMPMQSADGFPDVGGGLGHE